MNIRVLRLAFIAVLLLAFGAIAAACDGGGDPLTIQEYFEALETLSDDLNERSDALDEQFEDDFANAESEEDAIALFQEFFPQALPFFEDFVGGINDLNPPEQVEDAHGELEEASGDLLAAVEDLVDQMEDVESDADLVELFGEESFLDAGERFEEACVDLEEIAGENELEVGLDCEG